jgi:hypothetical protein
LAAATNAYAVPPQQVLRTMNPQTITGGCCSVFNLTVSVTEPAKVVPVVVTWSTDFDLTALKFFAFGISLNGGPCQAFGGGSLEQPVHAGHGEQLDTRTFQYVIHANEGLHPGANTFTVCGGSVGQPTDTMVLGANVLEARMSK